MRRISSVQGPAWLKEIISPTWRMRAGPRAGAPRHVAFAAAGLVVQAIEAVVGKEAELGTACCRHALRSGVLSRAARVRLANNASMRLFCAGSSLSHRRSRMLAPLPIIGRCRHRSPGKTARSWSITASAEADSIRQARLLMATLLPGPAPSQSAPRHRRTSVLRRRIKTILHDLMGQSALLSLRLSSAVCSRARASEFA